jgi:Tfp pilus assembly PilM family ATPase
MKSTSNKGLYAAFDIGTAAIKAVIIEVTDTGKRLATIEDEPLKPVSDFPGEDEYRQHIIEALLNLTGRLPMKECRHVSALYSNRELQVKIIELPSQVQVDQIDKILNWEAKKLLSPNFREEPYAFAYRIIRKNPYMVALSVIPQRLLERFAETFEAAGITLDSSYGEVFASDALREIVDISGLPAMSIVNFGYSGTHLQIFAAGELRFYRFIPSGMSEMTIPPGDNELEMFAQKIRFSFDYFRAISKLNQIDSLFFMGGGAALPGALPFSRNYFSPSRVNIVDTSGGIDISPILPEITDNSPAEEKQRRLLPFIPAVGAILACLSEQSASMNLSECLKNKKRDKRMKELAKLLPLWAGIIGLLVIIILLVSMRSSMQQRLDETIKQMESARMGVEALNIKANRLRSSLDTAIKLSPPARKVLLPVIQNRLGIDQLLFVMAQARPEGLKIDEILIRSESEAETIELPGEEAQMSGDTGDTGGYSDTTPKNEFVSSLADGSGDSDQSGEGLLGKFIIIRGTAASNEELSSFSSLLTEKRIIRRYKTISSRKARPSGLEFLIRGELP